MSSPAKTKNVLEKKFTGIDLDLQELYEHRKQPCSLLAYSRIRAEYNKVRDANSLIGMTDVTPFTILSFYMNQIVKKLGSESEGSLFGTVEFEKSFIANCEKGELVEYHKETGLLAGVPYIGFRHFANGAIQVATEPSFSEDRPPLSDVELSADRGCMYYVANQFVGFAIAHKINSAVRLLAQHHKVFTMTDTIPGITTITRSFADAKVLSDEPPVTSDSNMGKVVIIMGLLMDYQMDRYLHALAVLLESTGSSVTIYYCTTKVLPRDQSMPGPSNLDSNNYPKKMTIAELDAIMLMQPETNLKNRDPNGFPKKMTREELEAIMSEDPAFFDFHGQSDLRKAKKQILFDMKKEDSYAFAVTEIDNVIWENTTHSEMTMPVRNFPKEPKGKSIQIHRGQTDRGLLDFPEFLLRAESQEAINTKLASYNN